MRIDLACDGFTIARERTAAAPIVEQLLDSVCHGRGIQAAAMVEQPGGRKGVDVRVTKIDGHQVAHRLRAAVGDRPPTAARTGRRPGVGSNDLMVVFLVAAKHPLDPVGGASQRTKAFEGSGPHRVCVAQRLIEAPHLSLHQRQLCPQAGEHLCLQPCGVATARIALI